MLYIFCLIYNIVQIIKKKYLYVKDNLVLIKCADKEDIIINYDLNNLYYKKELKFNYNLNDLEISNVDYDYIYLEGDNRSVKCSIKNERCVSVD